MNTPDDVPDGDTIGHFRNLLTKYGLQKKIFDMVVEIFMERGLILKKRTIVDSTFVEAASSTKNKEKGSGSPLGEERQYIALRL